MEDTSNIGNKVKEVIARHTDLEQSQNKAQGALLTVLALTQVTELKILLDVGGHRHKLYNFVLALLVCSIVLQIIVGVIVIYIGHLRYQKDSRKKHRCHRLSECFSCTCKPECCHRKPKKRSPSYINVPIGVGAPEIKRETLELTSSQCLDDNDDEQQTPGCCRCLAVDKGHVNTAVESGNASERHHVDIEQAKLKLSDAVATILRLTSEVEKLESDLKTRRNQESESALATAREHLQVARIEKEEADSELALAKSRQKQMMTLTSLLQDKEERATFRKIRFWQQVALYLLYFITLMNVFVTAIGISTHDI